MSATKKKLVTTVFAMLVIVVSFVCGTLAYFTDGVASHNAIVITTGAAEATITDLTYVNGSSDPISGSAEIDVLPGYVFAKDVKTENTGSVPFYVRGKIDCLITLADEHDGREGEIDYSLIVPDIDTENWVYSDGYYYYKQAIYRGEETTSLVDTVAFSEAMGNMYKNSKVYFKVRIEIVQSANNGANALEANGWTTSEGGAEG